MYSVFAKTLVEGKAADILCEYSDPRDKTKFGDAQKIYADSCDFYEGGAMTCVSAATLESRLTNMRLNKTWTKTVSTFVLGPNNAAVYYSADLQQTSQQRSFNRKGRYYF